MANMAEVVQLAKQLADKVASVQSEIVEINAAYAEMDRKRAELATIEKRANVASDRLAETQKKYSALESDYIALRKKVLGE